MVKKTNRIRRDTHFMATFDDTDRKLLSLLAKDADRSYGDLAKEVHLSAPAVHERVKRLKASGTIRSTVAIIDGPKVGRQLLAFVTVNTKKWNTTKQLLMLTELADVEEVHTITGENALLVKIRTRDTRSLEHMLGVIHAIEGVEGTSSQIVLSTYLERGPSPEL